MKFIVEIPGGREQDLRTVMEPVNRGEAVMTRAAQDEPERTAGLVRVERFCEGELRAGVPDIVPWGEMAPETRERIGRIIAGQVGWQFHENHSLDEEGIAAPVREEHPEALGQASTENCWEWAGNRELLSRWASSGGPA